MFYPILMIALAVFTLLDALITVIGMGVGCVELNPVVTLLGIPSWVIFRILLLGCMLSTFFFGYKLCLKHFPKGLQVLKTTLLVLDGYIIIVVFSGLLAIYLNLFL